MEEGKGLDSEGRQALAERLDADLDRFMEDLASRRKPSSSGARPFSFDEWCKEVDQHPAFLKELKPSENGEYSAEVQAIQALKYDEQDPAECAMAYKTEGNKYFAQSKYRWAIDAYTRGIRVSCDDSQLNSTLFANRAAANRRLGNLRSAIRDFVFARQINPSNSKAILRAAECFLELGKATKCVDWIESSQLSALDQAQRTRLEEVRTKAEERRRFEERDARRERAKASADARRRQKLLEALKQRRIAMRPAIDGAEMEEEMSTLEVQFGQFDKTISVRLDEGYDGGGGGPQLVWPLLLQYPEEGQTDLLEQCPELTPLDQLLEEVFAAPADWDPAHEFRLGNIRLFVPLDCPSDGQQQQIREVLPEQHSLGALLSWPGVVVCRGLPVIQIYTAKYIQSRLGLVAESEGIFQILA